MFPLNRINRWIAAPLVALIMLGSAIPAAFAATPAVPLAVHSSEKNFGRPAHKPPPPGQLTRRGVVGEITGVDADDGTITIGTKFGGVEIEGTRGFCHLQRPGGKSHRRTYSQGDLTPLLVSETSRVQLPLQHTPLATCLSTSCGV